MRYCSVLFVVLAAFITSCAHQINDASLGGRSTCGNRYPASLLSWLGCGSVLDGKPLPQSHFKEVKILSIDELQDCCLLSAGQISALPGLMIDSDWSKMSEEQRVFLERGREKMTSEIPKDRKRFGYRGMRLSPEDFRGFLTAGMRNTKNFHYMLSFAKEPKWTVGYAFKPYRTHLSPETPALSVIFVLNKDAVTKSKKHITDGDDGSYVNVFDVWDDIEPQYFDSIWFFDRKQMKFIEVLTRSD